MTTTPAPAVEYLDPALLLVDRNIRLKPTGRDGGLVDSIRDLGVLQPIVVTRGPDGDRVRFGHRRVAAALAVGGIDVPAVVLDDDASDEKLRLLEQWAENEHRTGLTESDRVAAIDQLAAFGMPAADIARRTGLSADQVSAAQSVAGSPAARKAADKGMTLEEAATVAEFEDDPEAVRRLVDAHNTHGGRQVAHVAQRIRDDRDRAARAAQIHAELEATGQTVVDPPDSFGGKARWLSELTTKPTTVRRVDPAQHEKKCPGHAVAVGEVHGWWAADGELLDHTPDDVAAARAAGTDWKPMPAAKPVCTDWKKHGHGDRFNTGFPSSATRAADMKPAEREKAKADRKRVVENNKAWRSAETVRREWLAAFAKRVKPPKDGLRYAAEAICHAEHPLRQAFATGHYDARLLLGADATASMYGEEADGPVAAMTGHADGRATMALIVVCCAAAEQALSVESWRRVDPAARRYLRFLEAQGYGLSEVERLAAGYPERETAAS